MIRIRKYRDIEVILPPIRKFGVGGEFRFMRYNCMGQLNLDTGWEDNRIVDTGLNDLGGMPNPSNEVMGQAYIGTSGAATVDSMVQLSAKIGTSVSYETAFRNSWNTGAPFYAKYRQDGFRFGPGNGVGTVQEAGVHPTDEDKMFARHVISPGITKAADETLDVHYRYAMYPDLTDTAGSTVIDGITYNWLARPHNVDYWAFSDTRTIGTPAQGRISQRNSQGMVFDGNIAATIIADPPAGASAGPGPSAASDGVYIAASYVRDHNLFFDLNYGNIASGLGIRSVVVGTTWFDTQIQFDGVAPSAGARIAKDATKVLTFGYRTSWTRRS